MLFKRPGGLRITDRAVDLCCFKRSARIADIGCGSGETVNHLQNSCGFDVCGVDRDDKIVADAKGRFPNAHFLKADAHSLPFADSQMDGLLYECSFSKMESHTTVLREAFRSLKDGGFLIINDFYIKMGEEHTLSGILGRMERLETICKKITEASFNICSVEDYSDELRQLWGQMILEHGAETLYKELGELCVSCSSKQPHMNTNTTGQKIKLGGSHYGYCQIIAKKPLISVGNSSGTC